MPDDASKNKYKINIFNILSATIISIFSLSAYYYYFYYYPMYIDDLEDKLADLQAMEKARGSCKYGPEPSPFRSGGVFNYLKIRGRVISKSTSMPVEGLKIQLNARNLETVTNKKGVFNFDIFNTKETEFKIELPENKTFEVKLNQPIKNIYSPNDLASQEATIEILL